ncbi:MAG: Unknown protein [uncultured Sulfurovum sp.]|uniref:DUF3570 domain-containing protein n=1 Tax=uncultured Sulfurovum sp. TaxID=269237 RepID=A0A6S6SP13_9BACT|nr:MAG: Unknown protein [uncultured Sulfurovum sp.]
MQLSNPKINLSLIASLAIVSSNALYAENYVAIEYLQYDENDNRVSVSTPTLSASYDIGTDYTIKGDIVLDAVSGATPTWQPDTTSGASQRNNTGDYEYKNQTFDEQRTAASLMLTTRFDNRDELNTGIDISRESDYYGNTVSVEYLHYTDDSHNQSVNIGASYSFNEILSYDYDTASGASSRETSNSINIQAGLSQILSDSSVIKAEAFAIKDDGYLTNPHALVVKNYNTANQILTNENRPEERLAYGATLKYISLVKDDLSYKANYRFYTDDWGINAHTLDNDVYYELNKQITLGAGLRYYVQSEADFYNASKDYFTNQAFASSDERLSDFDAFTYRTSIDFKQNEKLSYNLGAQFYTQSTGLDATMFTTGIKYRY